MELEDQDSDLLNMVSFFFSPSYLPPKTKNTQKQQSHILPLLMHYAQHVTYTLTPAQQQQLTKKLKKARVDRLGLTSTGQLKVKKK